MGNSSSHVSVDKKQGHLTIAPAKPQIADVTQTLQLLSRLDNEVNHIIKLSNIKVIPQDPNPQQVSTLDCKLRQNRILNTDDLSSDRSSYPPEIIDKLMYLRKHIHRDIFTTYTSNHYVPETPPPLSEIYLAQRDKEAIFRDKVLFQQTTVHTANHQRQYSIKNQNPFLEEYNQKIVANTNPQKKKKKSKKSKSSKAPIQEPIIYQQEYAPNDYAGITQPILNEPETPRRYRHGRSHTQSGINYQADLESPGQTMYYNESQLPQTPVRTSQVYLDEVSPTKTNDSSDVNRNSGYWSVPDDESLSQPRHSKHSSTNTNVTTATSATSPVTPTYSKKELPLNNKDSSPRRTNTQISQASQISAATSEVSVPKQIQGPPVIFTMDQLAPPTSFIFSPVSTNSETFHADMISIHSSINNHGGENDDASSIIDITQFPHLKHYSQSGFQDPIPEEDENKPHLQRKVDTIQEEEISERVLAAQRSISHLRKANLEDESDSIDDVLFANDPEFKQTLNENHDASSNEDSDDIEIREVRTNASSSIHNGSTSHLHGAVTDDNELKPVKSNIKSKTASRCFSEKSLPPNIELPAVPPNQNNNAKENRQRSSSMRSTKSGVSFAEKATKTTTSDSQHWRDELAEKPLPPKPVTVLKPAKSKRPSSPQHKRTLSKGRICARPKPKSKNLLSRMSFGLFGSSNNTSTPIVAPVTVSPFAVSALNNDNNHNQNSSLHPVVSVKKHTTNPGAIVSGLNQPVDGGSPEFQQTPIRPQKSFASSLHPEQSHKSTSSSIKRSHTRSKSISKGSKSPVVSLNSSSSPTKRSSTKSKRKDNVISAAILSRRKSSVKKQHRRRNSSVSSSASSSGSVSNPNGHHGAVSKYVSHANGSRRRVVMQRAGSPHKNPMESSSSLLKAVEAVLDANLNASSLSHSNSLNRSLSNLHHSNSNVSRSRSVRSNGTAHSSHININHNDSSTIIEQYEKEQPEDQNYNVSAGSRLSKYQQLTDNKPSQLRIRNTNRIVSNTSTRTFSDNSWVAATPDLIVTSLSQDQSNPNLNKTGLNPKSSNADIYNMYQPDSTTVTPKTSSRQQQSNTDDNGFDGIGDALEFARQRELKQQKQQKPVTHEPPAPHKMPTKSSLKKPLPPLPTYEPSTPVEFSKQPEDVSPTSNWNYDSPNRIKKDLESIPLSTSNTPSEEVVYHDDESVLLEHEPSYESFSSQISNARKKLMPINKQRQDSFCKKLQPPILSPTSTTTPSSDQYNQKQFPLQHILQRAEEFQNQKLQKLKELQQQQQQTLQRELQQRHQQQKQANTGAKNSKEDVLFFYNSSHSLVNDTKQKSSNQSKTDLSVPRHNYNQEFLNKNYNNNSKLSQCFLPEADSEEHVIDTKAIYNNSSSNSTSNNFNASSAYSLNRNMRLLHRHEELEEEDEYDESELADSLEEDTETFNANQQEIRRKYQQQLENQYQQEQQEQHSDNRSETEQGVDDDEEEGSIVEIAYGRHNSAELAEIDQYFKAPSSASEPSLGRRANSEDGSSSNYRYDKDVLGSAIDLLRSSQKQNATNNNKETDFFRIYQEQHREDSDSRMRYKSISAPRPLSEMFTSSTSSRTMPIPERDPRHTWKPSHIPQPSTSSSIYHDKLILSAQTEDDIDIGFKKKGHNRDFSELSMLSTTSTGKQAKTINSLARAKEYFERQQALSDVSLGQFAGGSFNDINSGNVSSSSNRLSGSNNKMSRHHRRTTTLHAFIEEEEEPEEAAEEQIIENEIIGKDLHVQKEFSELDDYDDVDNLVGGVVSRQQGIYPKSVRPLSISKQPSIKSIKVAGKKQHHYNDNEEEEVIEIPDEQQIKSLNIPSQPSLEQPPHVLSKIPQYFNSPTMMIEELTKEQQDFFDNKANKSKEEPRNHFPTKAGWQMMSMPSTQHLEADRLSVVSSMPSPTSKRGRRRSSSTVQYRRRMSSQVDDQEGYYYCDETSNNISKQQPQQLRPKSEYIPSSAGPMKVVEGDDVWNNRGLTIFPKK